MNAFRHYLALVYLMTVPPAVLLWLIVHPFVRFWRKVGLVGTYTALVVLEILCALAVFMGRGTLLAVDFGTQWPLFALGAAAVAGALWLRVQLHRHFHSGQMLGLPEVAPDRYPQRLVTEGLHARVRHPRYLQFLLAVAGLALIANHLAMYVMLVLLVFSLWLVVVLEEKELRERFGAAYEAYSRRVPRFIPRWRGRD